VKEVLCGNLPFRSRTPWLTELLGESVVNPSWQRVGFTFFSANMQGDDDFIEHARRVVRSPGPLPDSRVGVRPGAPYPRGGGARRRAVRGGTEIKQGELHRRKS
jgi:hypothetical protein